MSQENMDRKSNKVVLQPLENPPKPQISIGQLSNNQPGQQNNIDKPGQTDEITNRKQEYITNKSDKSLKSEKQISSTRIKAKRLMSHKCTQWFIIILVSVYTILIFSVLAIDDILSNADKEKPLEVLLYVEIIILFMFVLEIGLTAYGQGFKYYFRDIYLIFDAVVIFISIVFVIIDLAAGLSNDSYKVVTSALRGIFRFVRIFLLIRKLNTIKKIKTTGKIKTAAEQIMETLGEIKDLVEITEIIQDIDWAMNMIGSNKLYDPVYNKKGDENDEWFNVYNRELVHDQEEHQNSGGRQKKQTHKVKPRSDKILATIPNKALQMFDKINDLEFNCVELNKITKGQELSYLLIYLFEINDLYTCLDINHKVLKNFALVIQKGYFDNPYHNSMHAFDVCQTANFFLKKLKFIDIAQINELELACIYLSAAYHDFEHPGVNNPYLINSQDQMALKYNDSAVLENHHVSSAFTILQQEDCDITQNFTLEQYRKFREMSISIVLSTDMSKHFTDIAKIKGRLGQGDFDILAKDGKDKLMCIDAMVHACDVSNPIKEWDSCFFWTQRIMEEFWSQGDKEAAQNLPVTYLCDRYTTNIAKSQGGFINFVVKPLFEVIVNYIPDLGPYMANFEKNKESWNKLIGEYEEQLKKINEEKDNQKTQTNI